MTIVMREKKRPRILPYGFAMDLEHTSKNNASDVIPVILCWIFENIGQYDKKKWQIRTHMGTTQFLSVYFADPTDAVAFKLAWT